MPKKLRAKATVKSASILVIERRRNGALQRPAAWVKNRAIDRFLRGIWGHRR
jgi:hypothetical protein